MNSSSESPPSSSLDHGFKVVYRGQLLPGAESDAVSAALKSQFKMSDKQAQAFFSGRTFIVKKGLTRQRAIRLRDKLKQTGLDVVANSSKKADRSNKQSYSPKTENFSAPREVTHLTSAHSKSTISTEHVATHVSSKDHSRWVILGIGALFTIGVVWLFFSI